MFQKSLSLAACVLSVMLSTALPSAAQLRTATPTATPEPLGCCEVAPLSTTRDPFCGNGIKQSACFAAFGSRARFCTTCDCSSHTEAGFTFTRGVCQPEATPSATATATATATPTAPLRGCCQVNTSRPGPHPFVCGNDISPESCLGDFGSSATFCPDCICSSHSDPGFGSAAGTCLQRGPSRRPRPTRIPRAPRIRPTRPAR